LAVIRHGNRRSINLSKSKCAYIAIRYSGEGLGIRREELKSPRIFSGNWNLVEVREVHNPALKSLEGKTVVEVARERGKDPLDTFFDIAVEDHLHTEYVIALFNVQEDRVAKLITDPRAMIGLSDGGAHVDMHDNAGYCTYLLGNWVRTNRS
jgi:N-acyl-D-aspartate/D-glutamate deacylase